MKKLEQAIKEGVPLPSLLEATPSIDVQARDPDQRTPLFWACSADREDVVAYLIEKGASPNAQDDVRLHFTHSGAVDSASRGSEQG